MSETKGSTKATEQQRTATDRTAVTNGDAATSPEGAVVVGLPAYNEEVAIGSVVVNAGRYADEVVVVDDGSSDDTASVARGAGATVIRHETNRGKGGAMKSLLNYARNRDLGALVVLDADGQHLPRNVPDVAAPVVEGRADLVVGSRYLQRGSEDETPLYRRVGQRVLDFATLGVDDRGLTDTQSGFRAFSPEALAVLAPSTDGIGIESDMLSDALRKELTVEEVPIQVNYSGVDGQTYNPVRHGMIVIQSMLQLIRDRHPILFFSAPGVLFVCLGTLYGIDGILVYRSTGEFYPAKVFVAGFLTVIGVVSVFSGLMLNRIAKLIGDLSQTSGRDTERT